LIVLGTSRLLLWSRANVLLLALVQTTVAVAASPAPIPHGQNKAPGEPLAPADAVAKMTVPEGFQVELVAAEPDIVNPVAMTFDERGRIWITESVEYPRHDAGPGRDRIKVLEDTDGDGRADRFTIFADGLNIPSGIAVGAGGVWVANAPDILFLQDTDGDGRADRREVVVTGFGRDDTHELPNSLTWGPDGWLYGLNGVFNRGLVRQDDREYRFTAAMFRIHPRTRRFELFAEGTSNPWGIAWDGEGSAFVSACVIDHLWHLVQSGYYHRQAGAYPPFAWKIESIVQHRHQQAAYCGIHYFDSDAYPEQYRRKLYMGNIHGNCINCDSLDRDGSTYTGHGEPDFLSANDAWFMPVVQKTGPDGCLYILDWYDRYHCYQDAGRDPEGIDRAKGRLYRVRYQNTPRASSFDLAKEKDDQLIARLRSPNIYFRDLAQRLLGERADADSRPKLERLVLDEAAPRVARMHGLWALLGMGDLPSDFHSGLLACSDAGLRAWGVRAAGNATQLSAGLVPQIEALANDSSPDVRLQVAIAATRIQGLDAIHVLVRVAAQSSNDRLIPRIVWQNLHPLLEAQHASFLTAIEVPELRTSPGVALIVPRAFDRQLDFAARDAAPAAHLLSTYLHERPTDVEVQVARQCLAALTDKIQDGEIAGKPLELLRAECQAFMKRVLDRGVDHPLYLDVALVAVSWHDPSPLPTVRRALVATDHSDTVRGEAFAALLAAKDHELLTLAEPLLVDRDGTSAELRRRMLALLGRLNDNAVADLALRAYPSLEPELKPQVIVLLAGRPAWGRKLMASIAAEQLPASAVDANQIRRLLATGDESLQAEVTRLWGTVRTERSPDREQTIKRARQLVRATVGDPVAGRVIFQKTCGNCHKIYGEGQTIGPDITVNGRGSYEQLLSNVLDPSLVIGAAYQARTVVTEDGRILTGLLDEDSPERIVLRQQGGKTETIPRAQVAQMETSKLSLMPEDIDKQLKPQELIDLLTFLALDHSPDDPSARWLIGFDGPAARDAEKP
jgi:putative membrane-bound dehydrogenase-like protein